MEKLELTLKSKYRLQSVLDVREQAEQDASRRVATARRALTAAEEELARREQSIAHCRSAQATAQAKMNEQLVNGLEASQLLMYRVHLVNLKEQEERLTSESQQQRRIVNRAEAEADKVMLLLIEASKEVRVIEKHREMWQQQTKKDADRRDQKTIDEVAAVMHRSQQQQSK